MAISGAFAPVPTPLNRDGKFHSPTLRAHLKWLAAQGLDGALILGTNGEFAGMAMHERLHIARKAVDVKPPGFRLLLNVSSCALPEALKLAALAYPLRYDAILLAPPWYYRNASMSGLAAFIRAVLDASRLPVILYHIPQLTGVPFGDALLDAIGPHANLAGIKDSTGDEAELRRLSARFAAGSYFVGNDKLVAACHAAGGKGSITACASVVPDLVAAIKRDPGQQGKLNSVRALLEKFGLAAAVKAVLRRHGIGEYASRPPMEDLAEGLTAQMFAMLDALGVLADGADALK
jgi:dihydrodipicolinate synthase/N-acetylneuraminate lyase